MSYRFGGKTRPGLDVADWLNRRNKPWWTQIGQTAGDAISATVTCDATAHTKGAWTQLVASTAVNTDTVYLTITSNTNGVDTSTLADLAIGSAGNEVAIIENIGIGGQSAVTTPLFLKIPAGSRLSMRGQSLVTGGKTFTVSGFIFNSGFYDFAPASLEVFGTSTATSAGTAVTNSYSQIVASTSSAYSAIQVIPSFSSSGAAGSTQTFTVAVGGSGSEVDIGTMALSISSIEAVLSRVGQLGVFQGPFAAGTRISIKATNTVTGLSACVIGLPIV